MSPTALDAARIAAMRAGRWLAFGMTGQVGMAIQAHMPLAGVELLAVTRQTGAADSPGLHWQTGRLPDRVPDVGDRDVILSLGPLDLFVDWFAAASVRGARVIALGSTSARFKASSPDAGERELARRLQTSEDRLFDIGCRRDCAVTVLRPTLMYGNGLDRSLTPILQFARRWHVCPLPRTASGSRQPVHVEDVAAAVLACVAAQATVGRAYDLPGAEDLAFEAMVRRLLQARAPGTAVVRVPGWLFAPAFATAWRQQDQPSSARGVIARLAQDQTADAGPARRDFGYRPRAFAP